MTKYKKFLKFVYYFCGLFGFIAYFSYLLKQIIWFEGMLPFVIAALGTLITGVPVFFRKFFVSHLPKKVFSVLEAVFSYGMLFYTVTFIILAVYIFSVNSGTVTASELDSDTVFIVYGAGLDGDVPRKTLRRRLDKTAEYMDALPDSVCIVTGSRGVGETVSEAEAMRTYLIREKGIDEDRIIIEDKAKNTIENIEYSKKLLEELGLSKKRIVSVSNAFHIPRIKIISERLGLYGEYIAADDPNPYSLYTVIVREYMSYVKLFIFGTE